LRRVSGVWKELLKIYQENCLNEGNPECLFAETLLFNEGWLLRSVLKEWKIGSMTPELTFLPFPPDARVYSEGQLRTPFKVRRRSQRTGEPKGETNTRVDGIAGHFSIAAGTKSGIELDSGCRYIAVFEAKLFSPIAKGTKNAPDYDQVSRTAACLIHALLGAGLAAGGAAHLVILYPQDNLDVDPNDYVEVHIKERIKNRLQAYKRAGDSTPEIGQFEAGWEEMFVQIAIHFETWEKVLDEIGDSELNRFYELCKHFNRPPAHP
jgi:hypothetical protein